MAIVRNMWLRNTRKQVAGAVFYQMKGQTIQREKASSVSNPRTTTQMEQRTRLANMVNLYRVNQPWMKHGAFENKKQTWSDYNAFVSANSKISPVYLTKEEADQSAVVIAPVFVTKGSLPSVNVVSDETNEQFISDLYVGDLSISKATTAAQLSAALRDNNNNLQEGDQLSFILNFQGTTTEGVPFITARYYEFIIDSSDVRTLASLGLEGLLVDDSADGQQCLCVNNEGNVAGGTIIVSRTISGNIKVSTQSLVLNKAAIDYLANYTSDAALQRAAKSYGESNVNFLASGYSGKASNVAVPIKQGILSITIGDETFTSASAISDKSSFGDTTPYAISIQMDSPVENVTIAKLTDKSGATEISLMPVTVNGNVINCSNTAFMDAIGHIKFATLRVTADGEEYTL